MNETPLKTTEKAFPPRELGTIRIDGNLYDLLRAKAKAEGMVLKRMVEKKLAELVEIAAVELEEAR